MIKESFVVIGRAARDLFKNWQVLLVVSATYLALLAVVYLFFATREATAWQLAQTAIYALVAPLLFFVLQAAVVNYARAGAISLPILLRSALRDFWKIFLVSLPLIALAVLFCYLLDKIQAQYPLPPGAAEREAVSLSQPRSTPPPPIHWQEVVFPWARIVLLGVVLPLVAAHVWLSISGAGLKRTLKSFHRVVARAFAPASVIVYGIGFIFFGLMPYFVIFTRTPIQNSWGELLLFGLRLAFAFALTLWGWTLTLGALSRLGGGPERTEAEARPEEITAQEQAA